MQTDMITLHVSIQCIVLIASSVFVTFAAIDTDSNALQPVDVTPREKEAASLNVNQSVTTNETTVNNSPVTVSSVDWTKNSMDNATTTVVQKQPQDINNNNNNDNNNSDKKNGSKAMIGCDVLLLVLLSVLSLITLL
jgi:hypothetical protein